MPVSPSTAPVVLSILSAIASIISASTALVVSRRAVKADRSRRIRDVALAANRVVAIGVTVGELANQLKTARRSMTSLSGRSFGTGEDRMKSIENKQKSAGEFESLARAILTNDVAKLNDSQLSKELIQLEGNVVHLERVVATFTREIDALEASRLNYFERRSLEQRR